MHGGKCSKVKEISYCSASADGYSVRISDLPIFSRRLSCYCEIFPNV